MTSERLVKLIESCEPENRAATFVVRQIKETGFTTDEIGDAADLGYLERLGCDPKDGTTYRVGPQGRAYLANYHENNVWWKTFPGWLLLAVFAAIAAITGIIAILK